MGRTRGRPPDRSEARGGRSVRSGEPTERLTAGNAFSVEPGIYVEGKWGARIEDIVVVTRYGADSLNTVDHSLFWTS